MSAPRKRNTFSHVNFIYFFHDHTYHKVMNQYYIFLDDVRSPRDVKWVQLPLVPWTIIRNYKEFRTTVWNKGIPEFVAYDHDLSDVHYAIPQSDWATNMVKTQEKTGYDCAKFLCNECMKANVKHPEFVVHSMNPVGADNIRQYIKQFNRL